MEAGRPTDYSEEMLSAGYDYMANHGVYGDLVPSIAGLACQLGKTKKTMYNWAEVHEPFLHLLEAIKAKQERMLLSGGLGNDYNSAITKLMLAKHGYHDKQDTNVSAAININVSKDGLDKL
jgi:hypothetical protein